MEVNSKIVETLIEKTTTESKDAIILDIFNYFNSSNNYQGREFIPYLIDAILNINLAPSAFIVDNSILIAYCNRYHEVDKDKVKITNVKILCTLGIIVFKFTRGESTYQYEETMTFDEYNNASESKSKSKS